MRKLPDLNVKRTRTVPGWGSILGQGAWRWNWRMENKGRETGTWIWGNGTGWARRQELGVKEGNREWGLAASKEGETEIG